MTKNIPVVPNINLRRYGADIVDIKTVPEIAECIFFSAVIMA